MAAPCGTTETPHNTLTTWHGDDVDDEPFYAPPAERFLMAATWLACVIEQGAVITPTLLLMATDRFSLPADTDDHKVLHGALVRLTDAIN